MSNKYKASKEVPIEELIKRLRELAHVVAEGATDKGEFTMRIPAEVDRDADLVLMEAARRLENMHEYYQIGQIACDNQDLPIPLILDAIQAAEEMENGDVEEYIRGWRCS